MAQVLVEGVEVPKEATVESRPDLFGVRGQFVPDGKGGILSRIQDDRPEYASPEASKVDVGFYVTDRGLPWHVALARQLGTKELMAGKGGLLTTAEALAAAGSYEVGKVPVYIKGLNGELIELTTNFATQRLDTGEPIGVVGRGYKVFQERELAELGDFIVDEGGHLKPIYETGGHMNGYATFFLSMELQGLDITVPGDPSDLRTYMLLITGHDGRKKGGFFITHVRGVCANTVDLAKRGALSQYTFKHIGSLEGKVVEARKALGIALKTTETVKQVAERLALTKLVDSQIKDILAKTWPVKAGADSDAKIEDMSRHAERAFALYEGSPTMEGIRGTAWGAVNAVTEYLDHYAKYKARYVEPTDARAQSLLFGTAHDAKERAVKAALAVSK